jgi:hypothetical protein
VRHAQSVCGCVARVAKNKMQVRQGKQRRHRTKRRKEEDEEAPLAHIVHNNPAYPYPSQTRSGQPPIG